MKKSLLRIAGIPLYIHWSFWLLIIWIGISNFRKGLEPAQMAWSLIFIGLIFVCVVLHELGHALTARRFGIGTRSIVLLPIGGVANIERMPQSPRQELWITVMGPAVNVVIALLLFPFLGSVDFTDPDQLEQLTLVNSDSLVFNLFGVNVFMVLFNLIPAFPMDGGRILRATIALFTSWERATRIASTAGNAIAIVFIVVGIFNFNLMLSLVGLFVMFAARSELTYATTKSVLDLFRVKDVLITGFHQLTPSAPIEEAVKLLLSTQAKIFIVADGASVLGSLSQSEIIKALSEEGKTALVSQYMKPGIPSIDAGVLVQEAYDLLQRSDQAVLLVKEEGRLIGIVDLENIKELIALYKR
jgi:Zn-dependent protease